MPANYCRGEVSALLGHRAPRPQTREHYGRFERSQVILDESQEIENIKIIDFGFSNYLSKIHASKGDFGIDEVM